MPGSTCAPMRAGALRSDRYKARRRQCRPRTRHISRPLGVRLRREPVAESLLFAIGRGADAGEGRGVELAVALEVENRLAHGALPLGGDGGADPGPQARAVFQHVRDAVAGVLNRFAPTRARSNRRGIFEFEQMVEDATDLRS